MDHPNLAIDMGYRGEFDLTIKFTDQNGQTHSRTFVFRVYDEKPTCFTVGTVGNDPHTIYATTSELDFLS